MKTHSKWLLTVAAAACLNFPASALACAACFGQSDSAMAKGMNAGIVSLLAIIGAVLVGAASFFVFLARRAAASTRQEQNPPTSRAHLGTAPAEGCHFPLPAQRGEGQGEGFVPSNGGSVGMRSSLPASELLI